MKKRKSLVILCIALMILSLLAACGGKKEARTIGGISLGEHRVIATVNGEDVYEDDFMEWYLGTMSLGLGLDMSTEQDEQVVSFLEGYKGTYLSGYTEQVAMMQAAARDNVFVDDQEIEEYRMMLIAMYGVDEEGFQSIQEMWGFNDASFRTFLREQMTIQYLFEEITQDIVEANQTSEGYYEENPMEFQVDETRTVRHILVEDFEEAEEIVARLNEGADFGSLVAERSLDTGSAADGGAIGPFDSLGTLIAGGSLVAPFTEASFALEHVGDITQTPAESDYGYHIIILDDIDPAHTQPFEEVKDDIDYQLLMDAKEDFFEEYYLGVLSAAVIDYKVDYAQP